MPIRLIRASPIASSFHSRSASKVSRLRLSSCPALHHTPPSARPLSTAGFVATRTMSSGASLALHPISSTSDPAPPATGVYPVISAASASKTNGDSAKDSREKPSKPGKKGKSAGVNGGSGGGGGGGSLELSPPPEFFAERIRIYDEYKAKQDKWISGGLLFLYSTASLLFRPGKSMGS